MSIQVRYFITEITVDFDNGEKGTFDPRLKDAFDRAYLLTKTNNEEELNEIKEEWEEIKISNFGFSKRISNIKIRGVHSIYYFPEIKGNGVIRLESLDMIDSNELKMIVEDFIKSESNKTTFYLEKRKNIRAKHKIILKSFKICNSFSTYLNGNFIIMEHLSILLDEIDVLKYFKKTYTKNYHLEFYKYLNRFSKTKSNRKQFLI
jgi:uncharacterized ubiquitin-like protein YukD